jgi:hypothetical protein
MAKSHVDPLLIVIPWLGALVYLVARGRSMNERTRTQAQRQDYASRQYVRQVAGSSPSMAGRNSPGRRPDPGQPDQVPAPSAAG